MNTSALIFFILFCLLAVNARHLKERSNPDDTENYENAKHHGSQRHRRRSWQMNYGYDYPPPSMPYYPDRREYDSRPDPTPQIFRFPDMEDTNQNWGFLTNDNDDDDDGLDGSRPISFKPIVPMFTPKSPAPKLDHGSNQAGDALGGLPGLSQNSPKQTKPAGVCDVMALSCCIGSKDNQRKCFNNVGCSSHFDGGNACNKEKLIGVIETYKQNYSVIS